MVREACWHRGEGNLASHNSLVEGGSPLDPRSRPLPCFARAKRGLVACAKVCGRVFHFSVETRPLPLVPPWDHFLSTSHILNA